MNLEFFCGAGGSEINLVLYETEFSLHHPLLFVKHPCPGNNYGEGKTK